jgi:ankyrin repeat protein
MLRGINKAQQNDAYRLLQCLAVAVRPLRVEELAELLAFDFQASNLGGIPTLKEDWRWNNKEEAVLSTCSSLIAIVPSGVSRVVQFSHFSVKEYLTSPRLARSQAGVSRFHINLEPAHTIMAQACLGTLLRLGENAGKSDAEEFPLVEYAAQHWVEHAQFEKVSSSVRDGMYNLFDTSKPRFAAWIRAYNIDKDWSPFSHGRRTWDVGSPLYYAAFCGFYDLAERLIMKHPEQINAHGGRILAPLQAALYNRHFHTADLLHKNGAVVGVKGHDGKTPLHAASANGRVDILRWLLNHGPDVNNQQVDGRTPLHLAIFYMRPEAVQMLLEHNADVNSRIDDGSTPLCEVLAEHRLFHEGQRVSIVRRLLEHGADTNIPGRKCATPLHRASSEGWLEVARLLLSYGAKVDEKDEVGSTPFLVASRGGHVDIMSLLSEHGAVVDSRDRNEFTALHSASIRGRVDVMLWLLDHGADANALNDDQCTPLHLAARETHLEAVQVLLEHNADLNSQNGVGRTPLYEALLYLPFPLQQREVVDVVRRLLEHGADTNIRDHEHSTPLYQASSRGSLDIARLLISYGAIVDEKGGNGRTPFQGATENGHQELAELLLEHGAAVPQP